MIYTEQQFVSEVDNLVHLIRPVNQLINWVADKLIPHSTVQAASCRPTGCWAESYGCGNHYCCMCTGPGVCYVTWHSQWVNYRCPNGTTGTCWNCIVEECGYTPVASC